MSDLEESIQAAYNIKDFMAKTWLVVLVISVVLGAYGWFTDNMNFIGLVFSYFMVMSIGLIALFSHYDNRQEELEDKKEKQELMDRVEELEDKLQ